jgi:hypothetical protein
VLLAVWSADRKLVDDGHQLAGWDRCVCGVHVAGLVPPFRRSRVLPSRSAELTGAVKASPSGPSVASREAAALHGRWSAELAVGAVTRRAPRDAEWSRSRPASTGAARAWLAYISWSSVDTIWTGVVAGGLTAVAALAGQYATQRGQRKRLTQELQARSDATLQELQHQTTLLTKELDHRTRETLRELEHQRSLQTQELEHQRSLQTQELEHQTRAALRQTYDKLLVAQRRSRETSRRAATTVQSKDGSADEALRAAEDAHTAFIEHYHQLNLDANGDMWVEARRLRRVLDAMLKAAKAGDVKKAAELHGRARDARQNLERSFRLRLGHEALQSRQSLGEFDKPSAKDDD